jgi:hypothetical protein
MALFSKKTEKPSALEDNEFMLAKAAIVELLIPKLRYGIHVNSRERIKETTAELLAIYRDFQQLEKDLKIINNADELFVMFFANMGTFIDRYVDSDYLGPCIRHVYDYFFGHFLNNVQLAIGNLAEDITKLKAPLADDSRIVQTQKTFKGRLVEYLAMDAAKEAVYKAAIEDNTNRKEQINKTAILHQRDLIAAGITSYIPQPNAAGRGRTNGFCYKREENSFVAPPSDGSFVDNSFIVFHRPEQALRQPSAPTSSMQQESATVPEDLPKPQ